MRSKYFETVPLDEVFSLSSSQLPTGDSERAKHTRRSINTNVQRRILVVDDERVIADTLVAILNDSGFFASAAYCADNALKLISLEVPDLVITDVSMPGMDGIELAVAVRERFPSCKILLFSGHAASVGLVEEARKRGHDFTLLSKPIHPRDLLEHLKGAA